MRWSSSLALAGMLACSAPLSTDELARLARAEHQWRTRGFADYSIEMRSACFCPPEISEWARVEVVDGQVVRVVLLGSGEVVTDFRLEWWQSVEAEFARIRAANETSDWLADVWFTTDPTFGYPTEIHWRSHPNIADAGGADYFRNAQPLSAAAGRARLP